MRHLFLILRKIAATDVTLLVEGESGVGKEVIARAVHDESPRRDGPFVVVHCGAIPAGVIESELFGHARGAFTGAAADRVGLMESANGGTLFLDEIGELTLDLQPKLLRALEQREVRPIGSPKLVKLDARVIAATNRNLGACVNEGTFRSDLFYRLAVARVTVPPLRDRAPDIEPLATTFLRGAVGDPSAELAPEIAALFRSYRWPGNVRELKNVVDRHAVLGFADAQSLFDTNERRVAQRSGDDLWSLKFPDARAALLEDFEREYLTRVLGSTGGVVVRAAERAGIPRPTFYRMLDRLGLKGRRDGHE